MNVSYQDKLQRGSTGGALLEQATKHLEDILGSSAASVSAAWSESQDAKGRTPYTLTLTDFTGQVSATFALEELQAPGQLRFRLLDLWGDLLQARSAEQLKKLQHLVAAVG